MTYFPMTMSIDGVVDRPAAGVEDLLLDLAVGVDDPLVLADAVEAGKTRTSAHGLCKARIAVMSEGPPSTQGASRR